MSCSHIAGLSLKEPSYSQPVYKEECTLCFDSQDGPEGIDVCLTCYNGACPRSHAALHHSKTGHALALNVQRTRKQRADTEPPLKKLAIRSEPSEAELYDVHTRVKCYECARDLSAEEASKASAVVDAVRNAMSSSQQSEVKAWEEEITGCEHGLLLQQDAPKTVSSSGATCNACELSNNLWLCLTCGSLSCGRQQFGGTGGNGHALAHFEATAHPLAVKLGTITPEGTADVYCYACNDARIDHALQEHMATFGIHVADQVKTEKSMTELQVEQNLKFDFAMTGADGKSLEPLFGPHLTGLRNLGNSCYMASTLQSLFALPAFQERYYAAGESALSQHAQTCPKSPADCIECQMLKMADGLLSGRYSVPSARPSHHQTSTSPTLTDTRNEPQDEAIFQDGIKPAMFKALIGKDHEEFKTMRQQDADEFLKHLIKTVDRAAPGGRADAVTAGFKFAMETRLQCTECKGVRYRTEELDSLSVPVPIVEKGMQVDGAPVEKKEYKEVRIERCLEMLTGETELEYRCPSCKKQVTANQSTKFATAPEVLVIHARRFQLINWVPQKVDVPIMIADESLQLDPLFSKGKLDTETDLPEDAPEAAPLPPFDATAMAQLEAMGFPAIRCQKALLATGNGDAEAAMNWLFQHMEDADIDDPIVVAPTILASSAPSVSPEQVSMIVDMGFSSAQASKALRETGGSVERSIEWLFSHPDDMGDSDATAPAASAPGERKVLGSSSLPARYKLSSFISHKGPSVHSGHYVAHVATDKGWVLFNDEKVVKADSGEQAADKLSPFAYVYVFRRA